MVSWQFLFLRLLHMEGLRSWDPHKNQDLYSFVRKPPMRSLVANRHLLRIHSCCFCCCLIVSPPLCSRVLQDWGLRCTFHALVSLSCLYAISDIFSRHIMTLSQLPRRLFLPAFVCSQNNLKTYECIIFLHTFWWNRFIFFLTKKILICDWHSECFSVLFFFLIF